MIFTGITGAWGWMLRISGLGGAAGFSYCVEIHNVCMQIATWLAWVVVR